MLLKPLAEEDIDGLYDLCQREGVAPVLRALAERCAFESGAPRAAAYWDEAFRTLANLAEQVAIIEAAD